MYRVIPISAVFNTANVLYRMSAVFNTAHVLYRVSAVFNTAHVLYRVSAVFSTAHVLYRMIAVWADLLKAQRQSPVLYRVALKRRGVIKYIYILTHNIDL